MPSFPLFFDPSPIWPKITVQRKVFQESPLTSGLANITVLRTCPLWPRISCSGGAAERCPKMTKPENSGPPEITVTVHEPSKPEPKTFTWHKTKKVGEAADEAAAAFGLVAEEPTFQNADGEVLDRSKPLVAAGVRDGDILDLVSAGGGVWATAPEVTVATVEDELTGVQAYVQRHGWTVNWDPLQLCLFFTGQHPSDRSMMRIAANLDGYRSVPPAWTFEDPARQREAGRFFPRPGRIPSGRSSIFHSSGRICVPFNRLAYKNLGGPHSNWGGPECWLEINRAGEVRALKLAPMFAVILGHLAASPGMN